MTHKTFRSHRVPGAALLLLVLAITTGWTQTGSPSVQDLHAHRIAPVPGAAAHQLTGGTMPSDATNLLAHRGSEATLATSARALYQARLVAFRAEAPKPAPVKAKAKAKAPVVRTTTAKYTGANHFWFPALGISRSVYSFPCTRTREPANYVYRWGCAGRNNVYLLGHAWGVFKPLHDAYLTGRLKVGMLAKFADANGRVRTYRVTTWRVVSPGDSEWAIANQPVASMTLQTCIGLNRLNVRLVAID